jgi:hypothetical protein
MADDIQVTISQDSIKQIITAKVQAAVAESLRPYGSKFVDEIVEKALLVKSSAEEYRYSRDENKPTVLGHMINQMIREETTKAIQQWAEENRAELSKRLRESMRRNVGWANRLADQMLASMVSATKYEFQVNVTPIHKKKDDD